MPVDERLREAFGAHDPSWNAEAPEQLRRVHARRRREVAVRRGGAAVGLVAAAALAVAVVVSQPGTRTAPGPGRSSIATSPAPTDITGEWRTEQVTGPRVRQMLENAGLGAYADAALASLPAAPWTVSMSITRDQVIVDLVTESGASRIDEQSLGLTARRAVLRPLHADGRSVHRWALADGVLRLHFVSTTEKPVDGVPAEVWQRIIYDTADFRR